MTKKLVWCAVFAVTTGCITLAAPANVKKKAAFDMNCPEEQLNVQEIDTQTNKEGVYGVRGCGKRASYMYFNGKGAVLNSPISADESQPAPSTEQNQQPPSTQL